MKQNYDKCLDSLGLGKVMKRVGISKTLLTFELYEYDVYHGNDCIVLKV